MIFYFIIILSFEVKRFAEVNKHNNVFVIIIIINYINIININYI